MCLSVLAPHALIRDEEERGREKGLCPTLAVARGTVAELFPFPRAPPQLLFLLIGVLASVVSGLVVGTAARSAVRAEQPAMSESRRSVLAAALFLAPAAASAMTIPGVNAPGLVPATKKSVGPKPEWDSFRDTSHFWSSEGVREACLPLRTDCRHRPNSPMC